MSWQLAVVMLDACLCTKLPCSCVVGGSLNLLGGLPSPSLVRVILRAPGHPPGPPLMRLPACTAMRAYAHFMLPGGRDGGGTSFRFGFKTSGLPKESSEKGAAQAAGPAPGPLQRVLMLLHLRPGSSKVAPAGKRQLERSNILSVRAAAVQWAQWAQGVASEPLPCC